MRFIFNLFNHSDIGKQSLIDPMNNIGRMLEDLGHTIEWCDTAMLNAPDTINLVFDGFHHTQVEFFRSFAAQGGKFVIIATEEPTEKGFNHGAKIGRAHV